MDAGILMPALVSSMPIPSFGKLYQALAAEREQGITSRKRKKSE
jgi:hypothetical protein